MKKEFDKHKFFLSQAVSLAKNNVAEGGGPFGAVIVKDGKIIATGINMVSLKKDPTAHAEVEAIRKATEIVGDFELKGCTLYSSCEPCPMCLGAIYWARIDNLYFASSREDAHNAGFSDANIYEELQLSPDKRQLPTVQLKPDNSGQEFLSWNNQANKIIY